MTTVRLFRIDGHICQVEAKGHTGYAVRGTDIVCAAVSSVVQGALLGLKEVAKVRLDSSTGDGYLRFAVIGSDLNTRHAADIILETMRVAVKDIAAAYPSHIKLEETDNVY